ncbi:FtsX-like permease family protein [Cellulomonas fimi]|uniref:ABC3 transporter permease C-terminal domain-containing protein n=1 Tax=Cellulomonas fimi (strain ATCC 484 / DSM 20113 / JCM 1341 / CCUG 24087 / LMG 16345 / NBRC 15513 / NCIMB 8980 / NCTC 7547 / NRS-133) TaxID=590998 RepID=F4H4P4_CELFA|nr:FtsX-like permease family protein [Cellulomonas fimi]AEE44245.1 protein of unknown function DUF214 [Cellulomonas fimi ATCC 484]NNH05692.1 FtsX-like permease family protein [Cellulomonas fimi]VEH25960.1 FtsX-like permease family [Cellulomonas fimi]
MSARDTVTWTDLVVGGVRRLRGRYVSLAVVVSISCAGSLFALLLGSYADRQTAQDADATAVLREITLYPSQTLLTPATLDGVRGEDGVESVSPFLRVTAGMRTTGSDLSLVALTPAIRPPLVAGSFEPAEDDRGVPGVVLPATIGSLDLRTLVGRDVDLTVTVALDEGIGTTRDLTFHVTGVSDPTYQVDAPDAAYAAFEVVEPLYLDRLGVGEDGVEAVGGYDKATVVAAAGTDVEELTRTLQGQGFQAVSRSQELATLPGIIVLIRTAGGVVVGLLLVISAVSAGVLVTSLARQRTSELGVLRSVGWSPARVLGLWLGELGIVVTSAVVVGSVVGAGAGLLLGGALREGIADGQLGPVEIAPQHLLVPLVFLVLTVLAASLAITRSAARDVVSVLRSLS